MSASGRAETGISRPGSGGLTWRPVFLVNIVLTAAGFAAAWRLLPADDDRRPEVIDIIGAVLLGAGLGLSAIRASHHVTAGMMAPSILVLGAGMGACFSSIYDVAIGNVADEEAGSPSGSLSAVQ